MQRYFKVGSLVLVALISFSSCSKYDIGLPGPEGGQGHAGAQGNAGNADVISFNFGQTTFTAVQEFKMPGVSKARIDSSLVLVYYNPLSEGLSTWYPCPGLGSGGVYQARWWINQVFQSPDDYSLYMRLHTLTGDDYSMPVTFRKVKIIMASPSVINNVMTGRNGQSLNLDNYLEVKTYFGLND
ncbi:hypothetical protein LZZ85_14640 [Terrimonas sp. NA20]|uniref:Collagen-like protein n=1 Tax=Terrimonas ginsenosidimutans TaxID=2908004 RepID=A0ABS9KTA7_9BACT|nr:hypothetical protein [Terrimonas ginsenosidimutans]MCG2615535.1 hypothetical protein [Terrimonas ginsenosidimutans]